MCFVLHCPKSAEELNEKYYFISVRYLFQLKTDKLICLFAFSVILQSFQRQNGKIKSFMDIMCILNNSI